MPPSSETSTPPTRPPPASVAVPWMVTVVPGVTVVPVAGETIAADGAVVSVEAEAAVRLGSSEPGWACMSAKRFTVACCMRGSAVEVSRS